MRDLDDPLGDEAPDGAPLELAVDPAALRPPPGRGGQPGAARPTGSTSSSQEGEPGVGLPGDPAHMSPALARALRPLFDGTFVEVRQLVERLEALTGWETRNRYDVRAGDGRIFLEATEEGAGWLASLSRNLNPFRRIEIDCVTQGGIVAFRVERPWTFWLARAEVWAWDGRPMGSLVQRFAVFSRVLEVCGPGGEILARVEGPFFRPWTFLVRRGAAEVGAIRKRFGGVARELFTDADTFRLELSPAIDCPRTRQLLLAATLLVDLTWFESRGRRRGGIAGLLSE